jgi:hypothetical protein
MLEQEVKDVPNTANTKDHILIFSKLARIFIIYDFYYLSVCIGWLLSGSSFFLIQWESPKEFQFLPLFAPAGKCFLLSLYGSPEGLPVSMV